MKATTMRRAIPKHPFVYRAICVCLLDETVRQQNYYIQRTGRKSVRARAHDRDTHTRICDVCWCWYCVLCKLCECFVIVLSFALAIRAHTHDIDTIPAISASYDVIRQAMCSASAECARAHVCVCLCALKRWFRVSMYGVSRATKKSP